MYWSVSVRSKVERVEPARRPRDPERVVQRHAVREARHEHDDRGEEDEDRQRHDLHVGPRHGLDAAENRVHDGRSRDGERRERDVPAQHDGQHDGRRGDDRRARQPARHQEEQAGQRARFHVEPALEILVRGVHARAVEEGDDRDRQDDHGQRQAEVELDEAQAVGVALPGRADERDGAQLGRHHGEPDRPPRQAAVRQEVGLGRALETGTFDAVPDQPADEANRKRPVERVHVGLRLYGRCSAGSRATVFGRVSIADITKFVISWPP